jgi:prepilin-type N-terminal cleavage/methylation domain-containing protein
MNVETTETPPDCGAARAVRRRQGFSLVEVCLALLVVGMGLTAVLGLFPSGLRSSEESTGDTRAGLFADYVFGRIAANADGITDWSKWSAFEECSNSLIQEVVLPGDFAPPSDGHLSNPRNFPDSSTLQLRYILNITKINGTDTTVDTNTVNGADAMRVVSLQVWDGPYVSSNPPAVFATGVTYSGPWP